MDTRKSLYNSVVLSGASTMFAGFSTRLENELRKLYKEKVLKDSTKEMKISLNIIDTPRRKYSVFIGACFIANLFAQNEQYWISKQEWEESGARIIQKKCQNILI